jgi:hypothetical protein
MADGVGRAHWQQEFARLQAFLPDLRGDVVGWAGKHDKIYVGIRCVATAGGRLLQFRAMDLLTAGGMGGLVALGGGSLAGRRAR